MIKVINCLCYCPVSSVLFRALDDWHKMVSEAKLNRDQKKQLQSLVQSRFQVRIDLQVMMKSSVRFHYEASGWPAHLKKFASPCISLKSHQNVFLLIKQTS